MKIAFVHDWPIHYEQEYTWRDGLCAAIRELIKRGNEIKFFVCGEEKSLLIHPYFPIHVSNAIAADVADFKPDIVLMWGDCTRPNAGKVAELGLPMALCFAGGQPDGVTHGYFDHFFVESEVYKEKFEVMGCSVSLAFGTNTDLFKPMPRQHKMFDVLFPATFARWKRHDIFAKAIEGFKACAVGFIPPAERFCMEWPQDAGALCLPHVSAEALQYLYAASKCVLITSHWTGGSQRTALEAMAMNIPIIVMDDSDKCSEFVRKSGVGFIANHENIKQIQDHIADAGKMVVDSRSWVLENYSEFKYADALEAGLKGILK